MAPYKVILAYDGTEFHGFQRQGRGRTVQSCVEDALKSIGWQNSTISAAGRTDTGVHATGQVISFDFEWKHSPEALQEAINANLPQDIAVQSVEEIDSDFHPRYSATARSYRYHIFCDRVRQPLRERYAWRVWPSVRFDLLRQAASNFIGTYDFVAFGAPHQTGGSTIRQIYASQWKIDGSDLVYEVVGNAFLYHMVRKLVSLQVAISQGKRKLEEIKGLLEGEQKKLVQGLAPAPGLVLNEVLYHPMMDGENLKQNIA
jgi:tRNA pseudouridine38-40 synthase